MIGQCEWREWIQRFTRAVRALARSTGREMGLRLVTYCAGVAATMLQTATPLAAQTPASVQVQIAAITWMVDSVVPKLRPTPAVVCFSSSTPRRLDGNQAPMLMGVDLDSATIDGVPRSPIPFRPGSACSIGTASPRSTLERTTGRQAVAITVGPAQMQGPAHGTAEIDFRVNGRHGGGYRCVAARRGAVWTIDRCTMQWIS